MISMGIVLFWMPIIMKFIHFSGVDTPICPECQALDMTFFNPECFGCQSELRKMADHGIGIASIMAVLRQWIPQVKYITYINWKYF